jgi:organic hydroperoxide reductase OsmC/OhrA
LNLCLQPSRLRRGATYPEVIHVASVQGPVRVLYTAEATADAGRDAAETLLAGAHERCPYSNATLNNIPVELRIV